MIILEHLAAGGPMTPKEIAVRSGLAPRTVTYALRELIECKLCRKVPNLADMRKPLYHVNVQKVQELERALEATKIQARQFMK